MQIEERVDSRFFNAELIRVVQLLDGRARLVGGCVRDFILYGVLSDDVDIATPILPEDVIKKLSSEFHVLPTGLKHGTVTIIGKDKGVKCCSVNGSIRGHFSGLKYEITTLRRDEVTDGRHAQVVFDTSWHVDSSRRDFTMNALYADIDGNIYDYHNGIADLERGFVRFIGEPRQRIREDYLRIMRFFRFLSRFGSFDENSLQACLELNEGLLKISKERVTNELLKIIEGKYFFDFLNLMRPVFDVIGLKHVELSSSGLSVLGVLSALWQEDSYLILSNTQKKHIKALQQLPLDSLTDAIIYSQTLGNEFIHDKMILTQKFFEIPSIGAFPLNGRDLIAQGFHGAELGAKLEMLNRIWVDKLGNISKEELLEIARL